MVRVLTVDSEPKEKGNKAKCKPSSIYLKCRAKRLPPKHMKLLPS